NKEFLLQALTTLGFDDQGIAIIRSWDFNTPQIFHIGDSSLPDKTEFMTHINGVDYRTAYPNRIIAEMDGIMLPIIHYNDLIANKKSTGRSKDNTDVEYLEKIMYLKKGGV